MLKSGVETAEGLIRKNVKVMLTQNQFDGLVSFIFNTGTFYPNLLNKLNTKDFDNVLAEMKNVLLSNGKIAPGLVPRRAAETELFSRQ